MDEKFHIADIWIYRARLMTVY